MLPLFAILISVLPSIYPCYQAAASERERTTRADPAYYFASTGSSPHRMLVLLINGSGCDSTRPFFEKMTARLATQIPQASFDVVDAEKQGVDAAAPPLRYGSGEGCSREFHESNSLASRVASQRALMRRILDRAPSSYSGVMVIGASDGGNVAAKLASEEPLVTHLVLIGSGGLKQADELRTLQSRAVFPGLSARALEAAYRDIALHPDDSSTFFLGQTYRYWSDVLQVNPLDSLLKLDIPIMVAMGTDDRSVPIESAYVLAQAFAKAHKTNLSLRIYGGANHSLRNGERSHMDEFMAEVGRWLEDD